MPATRPARPTGASNSASVAASLSEPFEDADSIDLDAEAAAVVLASNLAKAATPAGKPGPLPLVILQGGKQSISNTAAKLGKLLAGPKTHFNRGGVVVRLGKDLVGQPTLSVVKPVELASDFEAVAKLMEEDKKGDTRVATCSKAKAELILAADAFKKELPSIRLLSGCPVLVEHDGTLRTVAGYDESTGILANGDEPEELELDAAVELLKEMLADFQFVTLSDHSRCWLHSHHPPWS